MDDYPKHWMGKIRKDCCLRYSSLIFLIIINILSITALVIGFLFRGQCSIEQNISIYLVVAGFIFTIYYTFLLVLMLMMMLTDKEDVDSLPKRKRCALAISISIICLFMTAWLIVGCIWIFPIKLTVQSIDSSFPTYCQSTLTSKIEFIVTKY
ncbi:unnamed protein product [Adineta steineri]|uniref:Uncharacterized protein n=2 Tax=Adineta steineri TaxID=433720 RepID=A0A813QEM5_9BILA|nr:unnamed protein product [Adineta steineri]CAF3686490.1 unnamed protein product [Adineta steineri]